ncbi:RING-H2 finger protein ATL3-like [Bidens hawaiensis]|uniref:RING-H2 finger protein ATL3-like n=1 Tax=Bidens hawaiensis TaxID=980011 RepID=UPI00404B8FD2
MSDSDSNSIERAGKILIVSLLVLSVVVIFVSFVHHYANWFWNRREQNPDAPNTRRRRHREQQQQGGVTVLRRGLNPSFMKTIPIIPFDPKDFKDGLECAVCLSELNEGESTRVLPKCDHGFHVECIDMWFYSHSTCPICRNPVSVEAQVSVENLLGTQEELIESQDFPTNILFWGDETEVSTLTSQLEEASASSSSAQMIAARPDLVIDIPRQIDCDEDQKSPVLSRMGSLRRILSGSRRFMNPFSPANVNVEQGTRGHV